MGVPILQIRPAYSIGVQLLSADAVIYYVIAQFCVYVLFQMKYL